MKDQSEARADCVYLSVPKKSFQGISSVNLFSPFVDRKVLRELEICVGTVVPVTTQIIRNSVEIQ